MAWNIVSEELGEFIELLPPQKRVGEHWYLGTADAVFQNLYSLVRESPSHVVVLSGDHVYKMDYSKMLRFHIDKASGRHDRHARGAVTRRAPLRHRRRDRGRPRARDFRRSRLCRRACPGRPDLALASMGIYIFKADVLIKALETTPATWTASTTSAGTSCRRCFRTPAGLRLPVLRREQEAGEVPGATSARWTPTTRPAWTCAMSAPSSTCTTRVALRTYQPQAPPAKFVFGTEGVRCGQALDSVVSNGCIVSAAGRRAASCAQRPGATATRPSSSRS
jgi:glucose-1-phosphate adenylyltransferase